MSIQYTQEDVDTISYIYEAATRPEVWNSVLDRISIQTKTDALALFVDDQNLSGFSVIAHNAFYTDEDTMNFISKVQPQENYAFELLGKMPAQIIHLDSEVEGIADADDMVGLHYLNEHYGIQFRALSRLHDQGIWADALTCQYTSPRETFTEWQRVKLNTFLPHAAKVIELNRPFTVLKQRFQAVLAALDYLHLAIFIIEPNGSVVIKNSEGYKVLEQKDGIQLSSSKQLQFTDREKQLELNRAIENALRASKNKTQSAESILSLARKSERDDFLIEVCPIHINQMEYDDEFYGAFVFVIDPSNHQSVSTEGMQTLYNLTDAEASVCALLAEGHDTKSIADIRNVNLVTIKSQIKKLFEKTGVRQRSQLVRLALNINLPKDKPE